MTSPVRSKLSVLVQRRILVERRGGKRVVPIHRTLCLLRGPGEDSQTTSTVQNLSIKGVGVLLDREYGSGTILHALLVNDTHTFAVAVDLKVVRCFRIASGQYFLAGPFSRQLSHEEVVPFIR